MLNQWKDGISQQLTSLWLGVILSKTKNIEGNDNKK